MSCSAGNLRLALALLWNWQCESLQKKHHLCMLELLVCRYRYRISYIAAY